ncbi:MAG: YIP1 family protein [Candidatus Zixiibacteriota bacterium]|nr:MAG: YIP1 family protein [candidate division Zixibacteria bacterium]
MGQILNDQIMAEEKEQTLGFWAKLGNIFASPTKTFEALDKKPTWFAPILILLLISAGLSQITFPMIMDAQLEVFRNNPNITPQQLEAIEQQIAGNVGQQRIMMLVIQPIFMLIMFFLIAGVFYLIGNILLGGDTTYKKVLAAFSWSAFILILSSIIMTPLFIIKESMTVTLSPAMLLSGEALGTKLYTLLSKFDFFIIWFLVVFAIGFGYIYRFSKIKAFVAVGIAWGIWIALSVVFSDVLKRFGLG